MLHIIFVLGVATDCFVDPVWSQEEIVKTSSIVYGQAYNNETRKMQELLLDTYAPPASDQRQQRPVMVLIHGGAFVAGNRTSDGEPGLAYTLARRGYFVASIEYRLTGYFWGAGPDCKFVGSKAILPPCPNSDQSAIDAMEGKTATFTFSSSLSLTLCLQTAKLQFASYAARHLSQHTGWIPSDLASQATLLVPLRPTGLATCLTGRDTAAHQV
jgi:hypothetical protein